MQFDIYFIVIYVSENARQYSYIIRQVIRAS